MNTVERLACPQCHSQDAIVGHRLPGDGRSLYCPDCEHTWEEAPGPLARPVDRTFLTGELVAVEPGAEPLRKGRIAPPLGTRRVTSFAPGALHRGETPVHYDVTGLPEHHFAWIAKFQGQWRVLRATSSGQSEWEGHFASCDAALASLQQVFDNRAGVR